MTKIFRKIIFLIIIILAMPGAYTIYRYVRMFMDETKVLNQVIDRLQADSRIAEVLVTNVKYDEEDRKFYTTIKFVEYGVDGSPGEPKYFTFAGNIIQFQSLVIRFDDIHIRNADKLREKSAYLFWKVFMLDGSDTQEFEITKINQVPEGYRVEGADHPYEDKLWSQFWKYALDPETASSMGIKNAQIEAPGTMFLPSVIYTIRIEHDGGLRIDSSPIPFILKGEKIRK